MDNIILLTACAAAQYLITITLAAEELLDDTRAPTSVYLQKRNDKGRFASDVSIIF